MQEPTQLTVVTSVPSSTPTRFSKLRLEAINHDELLHEPSFATAPWSLRLIRTGEAVFLLQNGDPSEVDAFTAGDEVDAR